MKQMIIRVLFLLGLSTIPLFSQITVTSNLISVQSGTSIYCAAKYLNPQVQVYCYTTITTNWDKLIHNEIFFVDMNNAVLADHHQNYNQVTNRNAISFIFNRGTDNILHWQMTINGLPIRSGNF